MDFIDQLVSAARDEETLENLFLIEYNPDARDVWMVVEGKHDVGFFESLAQEFVDPEWRVRVRRAGRKASVLAICKQHCRRYPEASSALFFVDRDLSDFVPDGSEPPLMRQLCVSDGYSIENWLVSESCLRNAFASFLGMSRDAVAVSMIVGKIREGLPKFSAALRPVMAWCIALRLAGRKPSLDGVPLSEFVCLTDAWACDQTLLDLDSIVDKLEGQPRSDPSLVREVQRVCDSLSLRDSMRWIRGKYLAWFVAKACARLQADGKEDLKLRVNVGTTTFVQLFAPHLRPFPDSLRNFVLARLRPLGAVRT